MGISKNLRLKLGVNSGPLFLFGRPNNYFGERGAIYLCEALSQDCKGFLDVGANRGYFTYFLWSVSNGKVPVYFFEPNPNLFDELSNGVTSNHLSGVMGYPMAMGNTNGKVPFYLNLSDDFSSSLTQDFAGLHQLKKVVVASVTFDHFVEKTDLNHLLVKVDVEGAEFPFIEGASHQFHRIEYLVMEVLGPAFSKGLLATLKDRFGVHCYYINDFTLEHSSDGSFQYHPAQYNWLFCRLEPGALMKTLGGTRFRVLF